MNDEAPVPVLIVDDLTRFRAVMRDVVAAAGGFEVVGEARSGEEAVEAMTRLAARLVIMDKRMPGMGGLAACRKIAERHPGVMMLLCSVEDPDPALIADCPGARFIRKQELSPRLLRQVWDARQE